jgi:hypothetical protein
MRLENSSFHVVLCKIKYIMDALRFFNTTGPCNPQGHYMLPPVAAAWT